jgi:Na+-transporting NADH:ubiquinone oxidoreductase subunit A
MQEIKIRHGLDISMEGKPRQTVREAGKVASVAISGHDFPDVRPEFSVEPGDKVRAGQTVFTDRRRPEIAFTAPATGAVTAINRGRRRALDSLVIRIESDETVTFPIPGTSDGPEEIRGLLLKSGLWPSFRTSGVMPRRSGAGSMCSRPLRRVRFSSAGRTVRHYMTEPRNASGR